MSTPTPYGQVPGAPRPPSTPPPAPVGYPQGAPAPAAYPQGTPGPSAYPQGTPGPSAYPQRTPGPTGYPQGAGSSGQPPAPQRARRGRTTTVVVTALVTAVVAVGATLLATGTLTGAPLFDQDALEDGVSTILSEDFELTDVDDVACPATIVARGGEQFECTFTSGGEELSVPVEVLNDEGQYRVGGPLTEDEEPAEEG